MTPSLEEFCAQCRPGAVVPVHVEIDSDVETPVSAFLKLSGGQQQAFLFESVEGGERFGRWSFLGAGPRARYQWSLGDEGDPFVALREKLATHRALKVPGLPPFSGGLVGYVSYDAVRLFEPRVPCARPEELGFPDLVFLDFDTVVAFDALRHSVHVVAEARCEEASEPEALYDEALKRIEGVLEALRRPLVDRRPPPGHGPVVLTPRTRREDFEAAVAKAQEEIRAGECQQVVLSQRFDTRSELPAFELYRALRRVNPSPYLYFLQDGERAVVGSSPETLVRVEHQEVLVRPIAGTRRRGKTPEEDARLEAELLADPKENAEHTMLVDLGRNDVGRVAEIGSVKVDVLRSVERYSHVMHLVSQVRGRLSANTHPIDVLRATFPAGTVSGAPKVRAMQLIDELEPARRGPYAGCVGYLDRAGNMEMAITIRTLLQCKDRVSVQAGAGIVYDSIPSAEYQETLNKARALFVAVAQAKTRSMDSSTQQIVIEGGEGTL